MNEKRKGKRRKRRYAAKELRKVENRKKKREIQ